MPKVKMPKQNPLAALNDSMEKLRSGKKIDIPRLEAAIDRCERAVKASLRTLNQLRVEVRKIKKQEAKPKARPSIGVQR